MMRIPGRKLVRRALRPLSRSLFPGAVVLGYHRVASTDWDPLRLAVSPDHFASQVEVLKSSHRIVSLGELAARHTAGERLERYAVLTFDDGYRDFAETVLPIIATFDVPATVFVATGFTGRAFWWDEVAAMLAPDGRAPARLELSSAANGPWHFDGLDRYEQRAGTARAICDRLACSKATDIQSVIGQLRAWAGAGREARPDGAAMGRTQLQMLAAHPLVEIGAHTVSHGCLARLAPQAQRAEIEQSKADLASLAGVAPSVFSYPNGSYSPETPHLVEELGFCCACTSAEGAFARRNDRYRIPRIWVPDLQAAQFRRWLGTWVNGIR